MITANPDLIKSSPSPLRIGLVGSRFTVVLYLLVVCFQFLVNFTVNGIVYLSVPDVTGQVDQAATNSAFVTGVFLFVMGRESFPLGVDSWIFVLFAWVACDGAGRFIGGLARCIGSTWKRVFVLMGAIPLGICAIGAPVTWLVLTLVHKSGYLPPMHPAFYLLGLISLTVIASGWPLTAAGHIRRVG